MSRVHKKVFGLLGLALVTGVTAFAAGIPPVQKVAAVGSDVNVSVTVIGESLLAEIADPADESVFYDETGVSTEISYNGVGTVDVVLTGPDGNVAYTGSFPVNGAGILSVPFGMLSQYGRYILQIENRDDGGALTGTDAIEFYYHAITVEKNGDSTIRVFMGSAVCSLRFQVYDIDDTAQTSPLIDYVHTDLGAATGDPRYIDVEIPGFANLDGDKEYNVVVTAYDCSASGNALEEADVNVDGIINPPNTGSIEIFGLTVSRTDYAVAGLVAFFAVVIFAFFLLRRKKDEKR